MRALLPAALAIALAGCDSAAAVGVTGSNRTETLDCKGGSASVSGSDDVITFTGGCSALRLSGSNNRVIVRLAKGASVTVTGSDNTVTWTSDDGEPPQIAQTGSDNTVQKGL